MLTPVRWLALDIGRARVGVALSGAEGAVVTPLPPIPFTGEAALARSVAELVDRWGAAGVVVGVPRTCSGSGRGEQRVAGVMAALRRTLAVPVATEDERGTTAAAEALLREGGAPARKRAAVRDSIAAQLILESFLARMSTCCTESRDVDHEDDGC